MTRFISSVLLAAVLLPGPAAACAGDCDGNGVVAVNELVLAVGIALGQSPAAVCADADADGDGQVSIAELIGATNGLLIGCSAPTPTAPPSATPPPTATPSPSPTATANQPPLLATPFLYRGFAGLPIELPLGAVDPDGGALQCSAAPLLPGMTLAEDQTLRWTPAADQLGVVDLPYTCRDGGDPAGEASGGLQLRIAELDPCSQPTCTAAGCTTMLPALNVSCCTNGSPARLPEPEALCPQGRLLMVGRNVEGFGRLQNCETLRFFRQAQASAQLRLHVRFSCLSTLNRVRVRARLESIRGVELDSEALAFASDVGGGLFERRTMRFDFERAGPYSSIEGREGILTVTVTDSNGTSATERVRVLLTSEPGVEDLPDP